jgi:hypothetical protein
MAQTTTETVAPRSLSASVASRTAPPVVMTSSIKTTVRPATLGAFCEATGSVGLGLLPHEECLDAGQRTHHGGDWYASEL